MVVILVVVFSAGLNPRWDNGTSGGGGQGHLIKKLERNVKIPAIRGVGRGRGEDIGGKSIAANFNSICHGCSKTHLGDKYLY